MVVMVMEKVSESLRGELTRYMLELKAGVFVGQLNAKVTELLWKKVSDEIKEGNAILVRSDNSEQGYSIKVVGESKRSIEDYDGISLIKTYSNSFS
ncbi:CRISPR-associated protein Cas2 [Lachnospiraceae bacterium KH1T2]|nr:CRISPR-associated protein Cas2 [Lachnospiraceae bacterium KH1T2]